LSSKVDRLIDTLEEAKDYLATCQSSIGRQALNEIELDRDEKARQMAELLASTSLSFLYRTIYYPACARGTRCCICNRAAAQGSHGSARTVRAGMFVPTRGEVASMPLETLRPILMDWLHESTSELIPSTAQISQVKAILEARPDAAALAGLIEECRQYIEG